MHYYTSVHERDLKKAALLMLIDLPVINSLDDIFDDHDMRKSTGVSLHMQRN
jgi:hypothetical protein